LSGGPRVAFFTDTFEEINGVALTSRHLTDFARRHERPFLCVRGGAETKRTVTGSASHLELCRGPLAFELDRGLLHDPMLWRLHGQVEQSVKEFRPDIIHIRLFARHIFEMPRVYRTLLRSPHRQGSAITESSKSRSIQSPLSSLRTSRAICQWLQFLHSVGLLKGS
jgi:hypothetical protein